MNGQENFWDPGSDGNLVQFPVLAFLHCTFLANEELRQGKKSVDYILQLVFCFGFLRVFVLFYLFVFCYQFMKQVKLAVHYIIQSRLSGKTFRGFVSLSI